MHLVMFDIDGTLTETCRVDDECFARAVSEVLALKHLETDWSKYRHVTDSGITKDLIHAACRRDPRPGEIEAVRRRFVLHLKRAIEDNPGLCRPVDGADRLLSELLARPDTCVALATGGWAESALLKLMTAGLMIKGLPFASADDAISRGEIMLVAATRAARQSGMTRFESQVYVGDGLWDVHAAGWPWAVAHPRLPQTRTCAH